ncbi:hypothetical protein S7711_10528 [Stachybotrys chartarum IBT 7711]|uniref:Uncharacterized protein n=1 Tax=Stachybotrys chartarum (strain CBS 109288 / IBT 7711) TaxID=1280523 RepID=A0A084AMY4_STACB|nr:hypothetical protein S7711_10528 [Stachybotrys chartarum IBT 7711]KFA48881.1 hypothetical protein S40293_10523 [Stachybotrys chartarum IBT 40293]
MQTPLSTTRPGWPDPKSMLYYLTRPSSDQSQGQQLLKPLEASSESTAMSAIWASKREARAIFCPTSMKRARDGWLHRPVRPTHAWQSEETASQRRKSLEINEVGSHCSAKPRIPMHPPETQHGCRAQASKAIWMEALTEQKKNPLDHSSSSKSILAEKCFSEETA